jgi:NAD+ synthetase
MRIALAQINTTVGDFNGNVRLILTAAAEAKSRGAELCLFPEQCLPGYPAHDLLERTQFIDANLAALDKVVQNAPDIGLVVGFAERTGKQIGKGLYNSAALIHRGKIISVHRKSLLPTYDVFDEQRYFDPAPGLQVAEFQGVKLGVTICEDLWNDREFWSHRLYDRDPAAELKAAGAKLLLNISASPFTLEKRRLRREMLTAAAMDYRLPVLFCNSVGGNDELVFDGASLAVAPDGAVWAQAAEFRDDLVIVDAAAGRGDVHPLVSDDDEAALEALVLGTRDYAHKCGFKSAILGLSGGVDSALAAVIGARALNPENMEVVLMPSPYSSPGSVSDALELAQNLGLKHRLIPIDHILAAYLEDLKTAFAGREPDVTEENIQARIRGNIVMALSNKFGHLVLSTGNKSELATGYCTLYGDMAGGLALLSDIPKTMIYRLCAAVNRQREIIPRAILEKAPSAELKPNQIDQDTLPPYDLLDTLIERHVVGGLDGPALEKDGFDPTLVRRILEMVRRSEYKRRQAAPGLKVTSKAFGYGRRVPLASAAADHRP